MCSHPKLKTTTKSPAEGALFALLFFFTSPTWAQQTVVVGQLWPASGDRGQEPSIVAPSVVQESRFLSLPPTTGVLASTAEASSVQPASDASFVPIKPPLYIIARPNRWTAPQSVGEPQAFRGSPATPIADLEGKVPSSSPEGTDPSAPSKPSIQPVQWGELDVATLLRRPLNGSQTFSKLGTDRKFFDSAMEADSIRLQTGWGDPFLWDTTGYYWQSPAFCFSPLYFEQPNYERYGQGKGKPLASTVSAARFVGQVTTLPIALFCTPPWTKSCTLGHHRPGDWAPYQRHSGQH